MNIYLLKPDTTHFLSLQLVDEKEQEGQLSYIDLRRKVQDFPVGDCICFLDGTEDEILNRSLFYPHFLFSSFAFEMLADVFAGLTVHKIRCQQDLYYHVVPPVIPVVYLEQESEEINWSATSSQLPPNIHYFRTNQYESSAYVSEIFYEKAKKNLLKGLRLISEGGEGAVIYNYPNKFQQNKTKAKKPAVWQASLIPMTPQITMATLLTQTQKSFAYHGLDTVWQQLKTTAQYTIRLRPTAVEEHTLALGQSKLGGHPDLPPDIKWSQLRSKAKRPLSFVGQINCAEIQPWDLTGSWPDKGLLLFFCDNFNEKGDLGPWSCRGFFEVIYYDGDFAQLKRQNLPRSLPPTELGYACQLQIEAAISFSRWNKELDQWFEMEADQERLYWQHFLNVETEIHKSLGFPDHALEPMCFDHDGILLLQVDSSSETGMDWAGANGRLYFFLQEEDLAARRFDKVQLKVGY